MAEKTETKKSTSVAGMIFWTCLGATLFFSGLYIYQINFENGFDGVLQTGLKGNGTPLATERAMYVLHGHDISWMDSPFLQSARAAIYPLFECIDILLLRLYGVFKMFPLLLAFFFVAIFEGRLVYNEKEENFDNISSFRFHLCKQILFILLSFGFIFAVLPFGLNIPILGTIPIVIKTSLFGIGPYFWVSNPFNLLIGMTIPVVFLTYHISNNFSRKI